MPPNLAGDARGHPGVCDQRLGKVRGVDFAPLHIERGVKEAITIVRAVDMKT